MNKKIISILKYLLFLSIGLGLLYFAYGNTNIPRMKRDIQNADFVLVGISLFISVLAYLSRAYRWNMLIHPLGYQPKLKNTFFSLMTGYIANIAFPRIGEVARCQALNRSEKVPFNMLIGTVVTERVIDLLMLCIVLVITVMLNIKVLGAFIFERLFTPMKAKFSGLLQNPLLLILLIAFVLALVIFLSVLWKKKNQSFSGKTQDLIKGVIDGIKSIRNIKNIPLFIFHTLLIWTIYYLTTYICFFSMPPTSGLGVVAGFFVLSLGGIGMSAPAPGGFGTFHYMIAGGLTLFNIDMEDGKTFAAIVHSSQTLLVLFLGSISLLFLYVFQKPVSDDSPAKDPV